MWSIQKRCLWSLFFAPDKERWEKPDETWNQIQAKMQAEIKWSQSTESAKQRHWVIKPAYKVESFEEKLRKSLKKYTNLKSKSL